VTTTTQTGIPGPGPHGVPYFSPEDYLITTVKRAIANMQDIVVCADGPGCVVVLTSRGQYFSTIPDLAPFCATPASQFRIKVLTGPGQEHAGVIGRNIVELLWAAGFHASQGRLMEGSSPSDVVTMDVWPNFTRLPTTPNSLQLAALFSHHPTSIALASRRLKIEPAEVYRFYTAARCAGFAHTSHHNQEEPLLKPHRNRALLSMLLKKIASL
jgi:hypothetical protein